MRSFLLTINILAAFLGATISSAWGQEESGMRPFSFSPAAVGALLPLTGPAGSYGEETLRAIQLALQNSPLEIIPFDYGDDPDRAREGYFLLSKRRKVLAVIGPLESSILVDLLPLMEQYRVPVLTPFAPFPNLPRKSSYLFRNTMSPFQETSMVANYLRTIRGISTMAILAPDDPSGRMFAQGMTDSFQALEGKIVRTNFYPSDRPDFSASIKTFLNSLPVESTPPPKNRLVHIPDFEALYLPGFPDQAGMAASLLAYSDFDFSHLTVVGNQHWNDPSMVSYIGSIVGDNFFPIPYSPLYAASPYDEFTNLYTEFFGVPPGTLAAQAYDLATIINELFKEGVRQPGEVKNRLAKLPDQTGISGLIGFNPQGEAYRRLILLRVDSLKNTMLGLFPSQP